MTYKDKAGGAQRKRKFGNTDRKERPAQVREAQRQAQALASLMGAVA